jgi:hypothetical protein
MPESTDWTFGGQRLAAQIGKGIVIPLKPGETQVTWDQVLGRLLRRLNWMETTNPRAREIYEREWEIRMGEPPTLGEELGEHAMSHQFQEMLMSAGLDPREFPKTIRPSEEAAQQIDLNREVMQFLAEVS